MALDIPEDYLTVPELMERRRRGYSRTLRGEEPEPLGNRSRAPLPQLTREEQPEQLGYTPDQLQEFSRQSAASTSLGPMDPNLGTKFLLPSTPTQAPGVQRRAPPRPAPTSAAAPTPAGAGPAAPGASPQAAGAPGAPGTDMSPAALRQRANEAMQRSIDQSTKMPDMTEQVERYKRGYEAAGPDMGLAMFMGGVGGEMGKEMGGQIFKNALAKRQAEKTAYGTLDYEGFTADPMKQREMEMNRLEKQATFMENQATHAETAEERERAHREAERLRELQLRMHQDNVRLQQAGLAEQRALRRETAEAGQWRTIKDADGNEYLYNTKTGASMRPGDVGGAGAPGAPGAQQYPTKPPAKATEDEKRSSSQVQRIVSSAALMKPEGAAPGVGEAVAGWPRMIGMGPLADATQSAVRGMSGTLGIGENSRQTTYQSQADIIDSLLWLSTGAAYNKEQLDTMRTAYMPGYTDNAQSLQDKKTRLLGLIESAKVRAGRAWTQDAENALQRVLPSLTNVPAAPAAATPERKPRPGLSRTRGAIDANRYEDQVR